VNQIARERINRKQSFSTQSFLVSHWFHPSIGQALYVINMMVRMKKDLAYDGEFSAFTHCVKSNGSPVSSFHLAF
jgi:hypothetical protein